MAYGTSALLMLLLMLGGPQLAACGEPRHLIKDSKFPAAEAKLGWLDNERVIFHGYEVDKVGRPSPDDGQPMAETGLFIWDTGKNTVSKYWDINGPVPLCVFRGQVFFTEKVKGRENTWMAVIGSFGKEQQKVVSEKLWINGFSCRESASRPEWSKDDKHRRWALLEEHGYLDFGISSRADPSKASPIMLFQPNKEQPLPLPLTGEQVQLHVTYLEFDNSYLLEGQIETTYAAPVWKLKPDGTVTKVLEPRGHAWERLGWGQYTLTQKGLFLAGGSGPYDQVGTTGGYLFSGDKPIRLIAGLTRNISVSPDGCKVAFVHVLHSLAGAESAQALRQGRPGTRTVKMIDLCTGKGE